MSEIIGEYEFHNRRFDIVKNDSDEPDCRLCEFTTKGCPRVVDNYDCISPTYLKLKEDQP